MGLHIDLLFILLIIVLQLYTDFLFNCIFTEYSYRSKAAERVVSYAESSFLFLLEEFLSLLSIFDDVRILLYADFPTLEFIDTAAKFLLFLLIVDDNSLAESFTSRLWSLSLKHFFYGVTYRFSDPSKVYFVDNET